MIVPRNTEKMSSKLLFWGKLSGEEQDYLLAYSLTPAFGFPVKKFYFCTTAEFTLKQLPELSEEYITKSKGVTGRFRGDPSFPLEEPPEDAPDAEEGVEVESFREIHRLAYTVATIDHDVAVVPVGAFIADAAKQIIPNKVRTFESRSDELRKRVLVLLASFARPPYVVTGVLSSREARGAEKAYGIDAAFLA